MLHRGHGSGSDKDNHYKHTEIPMNSHAKSFGNLGLRGGTRYLRRCVLAQCPSSFAGDFSIYCCHSFLDHGPYQLTRKSAEVIVKRAVPYQLDLFLANSCP